MTDFWLVTALFSLVASFFILYPFFRRGGETDHQEEDRKQQNLLIYRERLDEIKADLGSGRITEDEYQALELELEKALLSDVDSVGSEDAMPKVADTDATNLWTGQSVLAALSVGIVVLTLSYALYSHWGAYDRQVQYEAMHFAPEELERARRAAQSGDMDALIDQLYVKLQTAPDNIEGWMLLARSAMNAEKYPLAAEAYRNVAESFQRLGQDASSIYGLLAQAEYFSSDGELTSMVQSALDKALEANPRETNALGLLAIASFDQRDYQGAIDNWKAVLEASPEHPARASIEAGIRRATQLMQNEAGANLDNDAVPASAVNSLESGDAVSGIEAQGKVERDQSVASIRVRVTLDSALRDKLRGDEVLFVFARAPEGPPMPLAASRHSVTELPLEIVLDDASAMAPMAKLSNVETVTVTARISESGQPIAQAGDLFGEQTQVPVFEGVEISLAIDSIH